MIGNLQEQAIRQHCKTLRMPTIGGQFARLADAATREGQTHVGYLKALLAAEMEERKSRAIARLLHEACGSMHGPLFGTLDGCLMTIGSPRAIRTVDGGVATPPSTGRG